MENVRNDQPSLGRAAFICPYCRVLARQDWTDVNELSKTIHAILAYHYFEFRKDYPNLQGIAESVYEYLNDAFHIALPQALSIPSYITFACCQSCSNTTVWRKNRN